MKKSKYNYIIYIGRFQPFHDGHLNTLRMALRRAHKVFVVIGSANSPRTIKNPWTAQERRQMILSSVTKEEAARLIFVDIEDRLYKEHKWIEQIQKIPSDIVGPDQTIAIIGHEKDASSYYLKTNFPFWDFVETGPFIKEKNNLGQVVSSTKIRELIFENHLGYTKSNLPEGVYDFLLDWSESPNLSLLRSEYNHALKEEKTYSDLPYGMTFVTVDSIVVQAGHIPLVLRDDFPGKGLWALPGTHLHINETLQQASIRVLRSEMNLKVPEKVLLGSLKDTHDFDHPDRSLRARVHSKKARTLTKAFYYELDSSQPLPKHLKAGQGIKRAWWFSFSEIRNMRDQLFEDHADIIDYFIG